MRRAPTVFSRDMLNDGYSSDHYSTRSEFLMNHDILSFIHDKVMRLQVLTHSLAPTRALLRLLGNPLGMGSPHYAKLATYFLNSGGGVTQQFVTKNDTFVSRVLAGSLKEKPGISRLDGRTVHFADGSVVDDVDTILCATGYENVVDFFDGFEAEAKGHFYPRDLYKHAFRPGRFDRPST